MPEAPPTAEEAARQQELLSFAILDTPPAHSYQAIVERLAGEFEVPVAAISLVDAERQWFKASVGVTLGEIPRSISFCAFAIGGREPLIAPDTTKDPRFAGNPLVVGAPFIRFYAGVPLVSNRGCALGALCVLDTRPRLLTRPQVRRMQWLAGRVMILLNIHKAMEQGGRLRTESARAKSEQFGGVLSYSCG